MKGNDLKLTLQGVFLDGELEGFRILDDLGDNISWAMGEGQSRAGKPPSLDGYKRILVNAFNKRGL